MVTLYNAISADGFISRLDDSEDFIPDELWSDFLNLCRQCDVVVMGRRTYEVIQSYEPGLVRSFGELKIKKVVVSKNEEFVPKLGYVKVGSPEEAVEQGKKILLSSGPTLNTDFYKLGLIDKVIFNVVPVEVVEGVPVFNLEPELVLESEEDKEYSKLKIYRARK